VAALMASFSLVYPVQQATSSLRHTIQELSRTQAKILGLVVNRVHSKPRAYYAYYASKSDTDPLDIVSDTRREKTRREAA
jgi:hypothetical protein